MIGVISKKTENSDLIIRNTEIFSSKFVFYPAAIQSELVFYSFFR